MTPEQKAVLAHVVTDPDAWYSHAVSALGEKRAFAALAEKVARWTADYEAARRDLGDAYKTRAERDAEGINPLG